MRKFFLTLAAIAAFLVVSFALHVAIISTQLPRQCIFPLADNFTHWSPACVAARNK